MFNDLIAGFLINDRYGRLTRFWGGHVAVRGLAFDVRKGDVSVWGMHVDSGVNSDTNLTEGLRLGPDATADWYSNWVESAGGHKFEDPISGAGKDNYRSWEGTRIGDGNPNPNIALREELLRKSREPVPLAPIRHGVRVIDPKQSGVVYTGVGTYTIPPASNDEVIEFTISNNAQEGGEITLLLEEIGDRIVFSDGFARMTPFKSGGRRGEFITLKNTNFRDWTVQAIGGSWSSFA